MKLILCVQYYACATRERQLEIDRCLENNLNQPAFSAAVVWVEPGAPPLPSSKVAAIETIQLERRLNYADWLSLSQRHPQAILVLANADIAFDGSLELLGACLPTPRHALALSRLELEQGQQPVLPPHPHWSQDAWAIRTDAPIDASLLQASAIPLGLPGCDNRIAHVLWSHGFSLSNPCYHIHSLHHHQQRSGSYDRAAERLFGCCTYLHPALAPGEASELEHVIWTRSREQAGGLTMQLEGEEAEAWPYQRLQSPEHSSFQHRQQLRRLLDVGCALGADELQAQLCRPGQPERLKLELPRTAARIVLAISDLLAAEVVLNLAATPELLAVALALPASQAQARLILQSQGPGQDWIDWCADQSDVSLRPAAQQRLLTPPTPRRVAQLRLRLSPVEGVQERTAATAKGCLELQLFVAKLASPPIASSPVGRQQLARFGTRFELFTEGGELLWVDRFWPLAHRAPASQAAAAASSDSEQLFRQGFVRPVLEWKPGLIRPATTQSKALLAWQSSDGAEQQAWLNHSRLQEPVLTGDPCELYVGLPWATFAKLNKSPQRLLEAYGSRIRALSQVLGQWGRHLAVHTVCQHGQWQAQLPLFQAAGISDLWLSCKPEGLDVCKGIRLHPWTPFTAEATQIIKTRI